jgi:predicted nucleotidyltransferase
MNQILLARISMDLSNPMHSVVPSAHGAVLSALARTDIPLSGRRIAELTKPRFSQRRVNDILRQLADAGIVVRESQPPSNLYRLNRDHVAADGIAALASMWATLVARIRAELEMWSVPPEAAWMFGSAARGEATEHSDIDILLVLPANGLASAISEAWEHQTQTLTGKIKAWSGNRCELTEMEAAEFSAAVERDDLLIRNLREQAVALAGPDPRGLLRK